MTRLTVEEIAAQVAALMDRAPGEYQHGDGMAGDHAFNRVTYDRDDWPKLLAPVEDALPDGYSVFRAPCGCTWPTSRLDGHPFPWCPSAFVEGDPPSDPVPAAPGAPGPALHGGEA